MDNIIEVNNLIKKYGENTVIDDISFNVNKGEIFALLGANGAGKTTTLECIEKLRSYNSGTIKINGKIGVQLQSSSLPENITVIEAFKLFCKWNNTIEDLELLNKLGLKDLKNKQYNTLSTGQKRRLHLALALIGSPDIIFLDEPTSGVEKLLYTFELSPILKTAYDLKQQFLDIKKCSASEEKEIKFRKWLFDAECSTIKEFKSAVSTLRQWHEYISNSFKTNFSNGPTEGKNNLIKTIKRISFGYRNLQNFRNRILLIQL